MEKILKYKNEPKSIILKHGCSKRKPIIALFLKLELIDCLIFFLDNDPEVWLHIGNKRLVTSPKLLSTFHGQQHFFCYISTSSYLLEPRPSLSASSTCNK